MNIEAALLELCEYGIVSIHSFDEGSWSCRVEIMGKWGCVDIKSGYQHKTPSAAVEAAREMLATYLAETT